MTCLKEIRPRKERHETGIDEIRNGSASLLKNVGPIYVKIERVEAHDLLERDPLADVGHLVPYDGGSGKVALVLRRILKGPRPWEAQNDVFRRVGVHAHLVSHALASPPPRPGQ